MDIERIPVKWREAYKELKDCEGSRFGRLSDDERNVIQLIEELTLAQEEIAVLKQTKKKPIIIEGCIGDFRQTLLLEEPPESICT